MPSLMTRHFFCLERAMRWGGTLSTPDLQCGTESHGAVGFFNETSGSSAFHHETSRMGTDLTRAMFGFDPICAHPWNPWLKQPQPTENVEEPAVVG